MSDTANLKLPLLAAAQSQKHVTMNEALVRLDTLAAISVLDDDRLEPPLVAEDGDSHLVGSPASGIWAGHEGQIAFRVNDGWDFALPKPGWRVWVRSLNCVVVWSGGQWVRNLIGPIADGAHTYVDLISADVVVPAGGAFIAPLAIPDRATVTGVTARVLNDLSGPSLTSWRVGVTGAGDRYGTGIGLLSGASLIGVSGSPVAYYGDTPLLISPEGGDFVEGVIRISIHCLRLTPPDAI